MSSTSLSLSGDDDMALRSVFLSFASFGSSGAQAGDQLDSAKFTKLCRDCGLHDKQRGVSPADTDLIFTRVKIKGRNKIDYHQFLGALALIAEKGKGLGGVEGLVQQIIANGAPQTRGFSSLGSPSSAASPRNYSSDSRSPRQGGGAPAVIPAFVDTREFFVDDHPHQHGNDASIGGRVGLPSSPTGAVSLPLPPPPRQPPAIVTSPRNHVSFDHDDYLYKFGATTGVAPPIPVASPTAAARSPRLVVSPRNGSSMVMMMSTGPAPSDMLPPEQLTALREAFESFASMGGSGAQSRLDSSHFYKLCRETGLVDGKRLTSADADALFARVKARGHDSRITFEQFLEVLVLVAEKKGVISLQSLVDSILVPGSYGSSGRPSVEVPTVVSPRHDNRLSFSQSGTPLDTISEEGPPPPSDDPVRHLTINTARQLRIETAASPPPRSPMASSSTTIRSPRSPTPPFSPSFSATSAVYVMTTKLLDNMPELHDSLLRLFVSYASYGSAVPDRMDSARFAKLCRETRLFDGKRFTPTDADLLFTRIKAKGQDTRIGFEQFKEALVHVGEKKGVGFIAVVEQVTSVDGPSHTQELLAQDGTHTGALDVSSSSSIMPPPPPSPKVLSPSHTRTLSSTLTSPRGGGADGAGAFGARSPRWNKW